MSRILRAFELARREDRAAFVPFLMAGDPDLATTRELVLALAAAGADVVELGVPFSDPIADGPVNQAAAARALASGASVEAILIAVGEIRRSTPIPIVLFTYFNPVHAYGVERFAEHAAASGADGVLCVDLPVEEAEGAYLEALGEHGLDAVFLLAPTSTKQRVRQVVRRGSGFVYYVSRTGVTGERDALPEGLEAEVAALRRAIDKPLAVGFGISTPQQAAAVARIADGVVVGSALVRVVEADAGARDLPARVGRLAARLAAACRRTGGA